MNEPTTIPALKRRRRRSAITIAICAMAIAIAAAIGINATIPLTTSRLQIVNTFASWTYPQATTMPRRNPWQWNVHRSPSHFFESLVDGEMTTRIHLEIVYPTPLWHGYHMSDIVCSVTVHPQTYHAGFLTPWIRYRSHSVSLSQPLDDLIRILTPQERLLVREKLAQWLTSEPDHSHFISSKLFTKIDHDPVWLERLRQGDGTMWSIRPLLLITDLIALAAIIAASVSITKYVRADIFLRRLKYHNTCPKCRYNLAGIEHQATNCPECGQTLELKQTANASRANRP